MRLLLVKAEEMVMGTVLTLVAFAMMVVGSLVLDMTGYIDGYDTEDDAHLQ